MSNKIHDVVSPGVVTGKGVQDIFAVAKANSFALPAVNVVGSNSINAVLEAANAVNSPRPLLQCTWIPAQIVVYDMAAVQMQINSLGHYHAGHQNFGIKRCVEGEHQSLAYIRVCVSVGQPYL